jgi:hypothetical protein
MVITRFRFSGRKSKNVNIFVQRPDLGLQKSARCQRTEENRVPIYGKTKHSGNLVFSGPVPQPGTKGLMTQPHFVQHPDLYFGVLWHLGWSCKGQKTPMGSGSDLLTAPTHF